MIRGVGVDLLHLPRLKALVDRVGSQKLASRICSEAELRVWHSTPEESRLAFLALRFA